MNWYFLFMEEYGTIDKIMFLHTIKEYRVKNNWSFSNALNDDEIGKYVGSHSSDDAYTIALRREDLSYLMSQRDHWYKLKIPSQKNIHVGQLYLVFRNGMGTMNRGCEWFKTLWKRFFILLRKSWSRRFGRDWWCNSWSLKITNLEWETYEAKTWEK